MLLKWTSKLFFKNLTKAISFAISLIVVFTLFSSPVIAVFAAMEGELNSVKATIKDIAKDIALVRFLKNNFDVHFSNIT